MKSKVTLEDVVEKIEAQSRVMNKRLGGIEQEIKLIDYKIDHGFEAVDDKITKLENALTRRVDNLEDDMRVVKTKLQIR